MEGSSGAEPPGWTWEVKRKERREKVTGGSVCAMPPSCWMTSCSTGDTGFVRSQQHARPWLWKKRLSCLGRLSLNKQEAELNFTLNTH